LRWQRSISAALRPLGITHGQFVILASVRWFERHSTEPPSQRQIGDRAGTDPMMTSELIRALERLPLLRRRRNPSDGPAYQISTTPAGRYLAERAVPIVEAADDGFFGQVDPEITLDLLRRLADPNGVAPISTTG
jgi:DNA-binding MarR family transcriptional regulator